MWRIPIIAIIGALVLSSASAQPTPPPRIALVIGNSAYSVVSPLPNARGDAELVAEQLRELDFEVEFHPNLTRTRLAQEIEAFGERLRAAGPRAVSFFYYAGHAAQDHLGVNYLIPTDATARAPEQLRAEATPLQAVFDDMQAANNPVNVLVLDACRDWYAEERQRNTIGVRGLRDMGRHGNVFIGLATTPGNTTDDGYGDNSPYTTRLVEALRTKANQPLSLVFDDIGALVYADTDASLTPEFLNGLVRAPRWCLVDGPNCRTRQTRPNAIVLTSPFLRSLERDRLLAFTDNNVTFVDTLLSRRDLLAANGIDSRLRLKHFLASVRYRAGVRRLEFLRFSPFILRAERDRFPTEEIVQEYANNPERVMNRMFAGRYGNGDEASGDGWRYRDRGTFSLGGRRNYAEATSWIGVDLVADPDLLSDPEVDLAVSAAQWSRNNMNALADADDSESIRRRVRGMGDYNQLAAAALYAIDPTAPAPPPDPMDDETPL